MQEIKMAGRRSDVVLAETPTCLEKDVKNVQLKTAA